MGYLIRKVDFAHLNRILDSYISALLKLKPDYMKIDMEIVRDIHLDIEKQKQLDEFISNGKEIGLTILAEGVEKVEEYNYLISKKSGSYAGISIWKTGRNSDQEDILTATAITNKILWIMKAFHFRVSAFFV